MATATTTAAAGRLRCGGASPCSHPSPSPSRSSSAAPSLLAVRGSTATAAPCTGSSSNNSSSGSSRRRSAGMVIPTMCCRLTAGPARCLPSTAYPSLASSSSVVTPRRPQHHARAAAVAAAAVVAMSVSVGTEVDVSVDVDVEMEQGRAAMRQWWLEQLAAKAASTALSTEEMDAARAEMRAWWQAQLAAKADREMDTARAEMRAWWQAQLAAKADREMDAARAEMRAWWQAQLAAKADREMDAARAEMRAWWTAQLAAKTDREMDAARAEMRAWWMEQLSAKTDREMDAARAEMREWWMAQLADKQTVAAMDAARAEMRAWWTAQLEAKSNAATTAEMDAARAEMREWWQAQQAAKAEGAAAAVAALQLEQDKSREELNGWAVGKWQQALQESESEAAAAREEEMEAARAAMRQWWTQQLEAKEARLAAAAAAAAEAAAAAAAEAAAAAAALVESDSAAIVLDDAPELDEQMEAELELAALYVCDVEREIIERELAIERAKRELKRAKQERDLQWDLEQGRKAMRAWWVGKWEAKKRSMGWAGYAPVWQLRPVSAAVTADGAFEPLDIRGQGVVLGSCPLVEGEDVFPYVCVKKGVSFSHALLFGKDKFLGFGKYEREYYVKDLGSTNGTFLNGKLIATNRAYRLTPGDKISFGPEVVFEVAKP